MSDLIPLRDLNAVSGETADEWTLNDNWKSKDSNLLDNLVFSQQFPELFGQGLYIDQLLAKFDADDKPIEGYGILSNQHVEDDEINLDSPVIRLF